MRITNKVTKNLLEDETFKQDIKWLIIREIKNEIQQECLDFVGDILRKALIDHTHKLRANYDSYFNSVHIARIKDTLADAMSDRLKTMLDNKLEANITNKIEKDTAFLKQEQFIDAVVERLNRKQLK